jgi:Reverse transcriptase (RNA-dependent DNA polymerase)
MSETEVKPETPTVDPKPLDWLREFEFTDSSLSPDDVLTGLLDFGLFSEKVPACFTSKGLAKLAVVSLSSALETVDPEKLRRAVGTKSHDYIRYEAIRDINIPRHLGIPHPESYALQVLAITKYWNEIKAHCAKPSPAVSRVHVRRMADHGCIFKMSYKGVERYQFEEDEIEWRSGAKFVVKADIATCFPSMYTHSIPWALHGLSVAKESGGSCKLYGNLLDKCTQNTRDKQTNGLLIGPHASNIIAEIILTDIDTELQSNKDHKKLTRYIDDYTYYADSYEDAERFLKNLGLSLRTYEMALNAKKTRILPLPRPSAENWTQELQRFAFPKGEDLRFSIIRSFLDLALENAQAAGTSAPLNYALQMLGGKHGERKLNPRAKRLYVQEAISLAISYPYLAPVLDTVVFDRHRYIGIDTKIASFAAALIRLGTQKLYPDTIAHALYYALKYKIPIAVTETELLAVLPLDDCVVNVLLLEYAPLYGLKKLHSAVKERASQLKSAGQRDQDRNWLLIYQAWTEAELTGNGQAFLSMLKKAQFQFLVMPTASLGSFAAEAEVYSNE